MISIRLDTYRYKIYFCLLIIFCSEVLILKQFFNYDFKDHIYFNLFLYFSLLLLFFLFRLFLISFILSRFLFYAKLTLP